MRHAHMLHNKTSVTAVMIDETTFNANDCENSTMRTPNKPHAPQHTATAKKCVRASEIHRPAREEIATAAKAHAAPAHTSRRHEGNPPASVGVRENTGDMASSNNHATSKATPNSA